MRPAGATHEISGVFYKVGNKGFMFHWINGAWIRSAKKLSVLTNKNVVGAKVESE